MYLYLTEIHFNKWQSNYYSNGYKNLKRILFWAPNNEALAISTIHIIYRKRIVININNINSFSLSNCPLDGATVSYGVYEYAENILIVPKPNPINLPIFA